MFVVGLLSLNQSFGQELVRTFYDEADSVLKEEFYVISKKNPILDGSYVSYFEDGNIKSKGFFKNNISTGQWTYYHPNGKPRMEGQIVDGKNYGIWIYYYETGLKKMEGPIIESKREGPWILYYKNGAKQSEGNFIGNKRSGLWVHYYETGGIKARETYSDSTSEYIEYHRSGGIRSEGGKINNRREGPWTFYYEDGNVEAQGDYLRGKKTGLWKYFNDQGSLEAEGTYVDDKPQGLWLYYHLDGTLAAEGQLVSGQKDGDWRMYYNDGTLKGEGRYANGDGLYKEYYKDGQIKVQGQVTSGKAQGKWQYFYENGNLEGDCVFNKGKGNYVGYYTTGEVKMKGRIEDDLKVGIWEFYEKDGTIAGYYKPHYEEGEATFFLADDVEEQKTLSEKKRTKRGTFVYKGKRKGYFSPELNEFRGFVIGYNPIATLLNSFPLGLEYYMQERLGYEAYVQYLRDPFFKSINTIGEGQLISDGFSASIRQKFYHKELSLGVPYFGHELRYSYLSHRSKFNDSQINGARESKYEYAVLVGMRYFKNKRDNGFTLDAFAGFAAGYRDFNQTYVPTDPANDPFSSLNSNNFAYSVRLGLNLGFVIRSKR